MCAGLRTHGSAASAGALATVAELVILIPRSKNSFVCFVLVILSFCVSLPSGVRHTCTMMFLGVVTLAKILFGLTAA